MRLLVVEDDKTLAKALKKGLSQESFAVDVTHDGEIGYDLASEEHYDAIILDRMVPILSGDKLIKKLRENGNSTPVLMLTAKGDIEDRVQGLDMGADDYLVKPFAFAELLARIRALSRRPKTQKPTILSVRDLKVNTKTYSVSRSDTSIPLSRREYALLLYLVKNAGQTLSKQHIIDHVWSFDDDVLPNTVEVYIRTLRTKIDIPFPEKKPLIATIRGFGYTLA